MSVLDSEARRALDALVAHPDCAARADHFVRCAWDDLVRAAHRLSVARALRVDHLDRHDAASRVLETLVRDVRERALVPDDACLVRRLKNRLVDIARARIRWTARVGRTTDTAALDATISECGSATAVDRLADREAARAVLADIGYSLRDGEAELLRLRLVEELAFDEIAELLGAPAATLRQRFRRTLTRVRRTFGESVPAGAVRCSGGVRAVARGPPASRRGGPAPHPGPDIILHFR